MIFFPSETEQELKKTKQTPPNQPKKQPQKTVIGTSNEVSCIFLYSSIINGLFATN